jgi:hypothetical protein
MSIRQTGAPHKRGHKGRHPGSEKAHTSWKKSDVSSIYVPICRSRDLCTSSPRTLRGLRRVGSRTTSTATRPPCNNSKSRNRRFLCCYWNLREDFQPGTNTSNQRNSSGNSAPVARRRIRTHLPRPPFNVEFYVGGMIASYANAPVFVRSGALPRIIPLERGPDARPQSIWRGTGGCITFKSLCTMLRLWQYSTADRICQNFVLACSSVILPYLAM